MYLQQLLFGFLFSAVLFFSWNEKIQDEVLVSKQDDAQEFDLGELNAQAPEQIKDYGQFVGSWDCTIANLDSNNVWKENKATWVFTYILDGHAIQDFWTNPGDKSLNPGKKPYLGTNIRIYNPGLQKWQCTWMENNTHTMLGIWESYRNEDNEIILHDGSETWEIVFFNITEKTFDWRWDVKQKDDSMKTVSKIKAVRSKGKNQ